MLDKKYCGRYTTYAYAGKGKHLDPGPLYINDDNTVTFKDEDVAFTYNPDGICKFEFLVQNTIRCGFSPSGDGDNRKFDGSTYIFSGKGDGPYDWKGQIDPLVSAEITEIEYLTKNATKGLPESVELYTEEVINKLNTEQTIMVKGSQSTTETSGWSNTTTIGASVTTKNTSSVKIPFVTASGEISFNFSTQIAFTMNKTISNTKEWSWEVPVQVPANQNIKVLISVTNSSITVPFKMTGNFTYKSKATHKGTISGVYNGINGHNLKVTFEDKDGKRTTIAL